MERLGNDPYISQKIEPSPFIWEKYHDIIVFVIL